MKSNSKVLWIFGYACFIHFCLVSYAKMAAGFCLQDPYSMVAVGNRWNGRSFDRIYDD